MHGKKFLSVLLSAVFLVSTMGSAIAATPESHTGRFLAPLLPAAPEAAPKLRKSA